MILYSGVQGKNNVFQIFFQITFFRFQAFLGVNHREEKIVKFYLQVNYFKWAKTTYMHKYVLNIEMP